TEAVTGLDLVDLQLRVAAGEDLPLSQSDVAFMGHAIEARVIAEDPLAGFLPSSGAVQTFDYPSSVRVDTWVGRGTQVSPYYDSLLAKVVAHGRDRAEAVRILAHSLEQVRLEGVRHNLDLLLAVVGHPRFCEGRLDTRFLEDNAILEELARLP